MKRKVLLGAPSSSGKGAKHTIAEAFAKATFPLAVTIDNKVARAFSLPVVGAFVNPCTHADCCVTVKVKDLDTLQRLGSDIEQLGFLHKIQGMIELEADDGEEGEIEEETNPGGEEGEDNKGDGGEESVNPIELAKDAVKTNKTKR